MKLNFVCIGAQKAGTTTLHDILDSHPGIYLPPRKEAQFFDINERYEKGLEYYFSNFFDTYNGEKYIGNINPNLQLENRSIDRLKDCFGENLKIIFILRNPVKRAYSHYLMSKRRGYENLAFTDALKAEEYRIKNPIKRKNYISNELGHYEKNHFGYIYRSLYSKTLDYIYFQFPADNIKIILFEEFISNKEKITNEILDFLNIPPSPYMVYEVQSNKAYLPKSAFVRNLIYKPFILKRIFTRFLSRERKESIKRIIQRYNKRDITEENGLQIEDMIEIFKTYFESETDCLEKKFNLDLKKWRIK